MPATVSAPELFQCRLRSCHRLPSRRSGAAQHRRPDRHHHAQSPAAFNSIDLSIARKLEQLGAEVEANDAIACW
jgi:hypothetical protein